MLRQGGGDPVFWLHKYHIPPGDHGTWMRSRRISKRVLASLVGIVMVWVELPFTMTIRTPPSGGAWLWLLRLRPQYQSCYSDRSSGEGMLRQGGGRVSRLLVIQIIVSYDLLLECLHQVLF
ncbi:hypothetical protein AVEN_37770-1 [Araneus ventricosus]|uniref:Uncharacterized protein n=1 Tax=Araneus ventricosus TaxID=182803 RepID=A0A4Y2RM24_ARAVE|nr:hypothetical protein AVEN_56429-1 [Araneus ventricosus]GBN75945.1 hypothetical protein AVEN_37770-1 [Araneus ventricosus]